MTGQVVVRLDPGAESDPGGVSAAGFDAKAAVRKLDLAAYNIAQAGLAHVQAHFARAQTRWNDGATPMDLDRLERLAKTLERYHAIGRTAAARVGGEQGRLV